MHGTKSNDRPRHADVGSDQIDRETKTGAGPAPDFSCTNALSIGDAVPTETVAICASLRQDDILTTTHHPLFASVGTEFAIAEIANLEALSRAASDLAAFHAAGGLAAKPTVGGQPRFALLLYVRPDSNTTRLRARMFGPLGGILEDPATGSACAALAALLTSMAPGENVQLHFEIEQGVEMGQPSLLIASGTKTVEGPGGDYWRRLRTGRPRLAGSLKRSGAMRRTSRRLAGQS